MIYPDGMAAQVMSEEEVRRALASYKKNLDDLTVNSKPLIDDLTRAAGQLELQGKYVVEIIQTRIIQVRPEWKLPCLYLLDSVMKNLKSSYVEHIHQVIVGVFCHCFEKLTESDNRKSLYKLRTTWSPFLSKQKLAAIDKHVHALDPNWPVLAVDKDPPGTTIFVNPVFIGNQPQHASSTSIQDRRKVLLQQTKSQRQEREREMGLPVPQRVDVQDVALERAKIPTSTTNPSGSGSVDSEVPVSEQVKLDVKRDSPPAATQDFPPAAKKIKVEPNSTELSDSGAAPIKESHLQLDDLPPELLPFHYENTLKKIERVIDAGNVTPDQRNILVKQLDQLYELQKLKSNQSDSNHTHLYTSAVQGETRVSNQVSLSLISDPFPPHPPDPLPCHPPGPFPPHPPDPLPQHPLPCHPPDALPHPTDPHHPPGPVPPHPPDPLPHHPPDPLPLHPPELLPPHPPDPFPRHLPEPGHLRGRTAYRGFRGRHRPYRNRGRSYVNSQDRGSSRAQDVGPPVPVGDLFKNLINAGMISDEGKQTEVPGNHPLKIPNLTLTPATLKQHYSSVVALLHVGDPCSSCGLRFSSHSGDLYRSHLNWHYKVNRQEKEGLSKSSRNWFMHPDDWMKYEEVHDEADGSDVLEVPREESPVKFALSERSSEGREKAGCSVEAGDINEVCAACNEPFEQFWEEEEAAWHFRNALRTDPGGKLYHTFCYKDIHS